MKLKKRRRSKEEISVGKWSKNEFTVKNESKKKIHRYIVINNKY